MSPPSWRDVDVYCGRERRADSRPPPFPELTGSRRSVHPAHATAAGHRGQLLLLLLLHHHALGGEEQSRDGRGVLQRGAGDLGGVDDAGRDQILVLVDRKSTRLNSSHTVISYAVFCLKKKKKTNKRTSETSY